MYTKYFYSAGATAANILADVVALLTGETNKDNLSASCDKTTTVIDASVRVAGWESYDASAGTNAVCLRAAFADSASAYKYMVVDTNSAGYILLKGYESWNSGSNVGTNLCNYSDNTTSYTQRLLVASGGRLEISASARHCFMFSLQNGVYGNSYATGPSGIFERTRLSPWDTVANGFPPFLFYADMASAMFGPRFLSKSNADLTTTNAVYTIVQAFGAAAATLPTTSVVSNAARDVFGHVMVPFGCCNAPNGHLGGDISGFADIYLTTYNSGSSFDTITYNSNTYIIWAVGANWRFAVRVG